MLDFEQIKASLSQRFPFLLVDKIVEIDEGKKVVGHDGIFELPADLFIGLVVGTGDEKYFFFHFLLPVRKCFLSFYPNL